MLSAVDSAVVAPYGECLHFSCPVGTYSLSTILAGLRLLYLCKIRIGGVVLSRVPKNPLPELLEHPSFSGQVIYPPLYQPASQVQSKSKLHWCVQVRELSDRQCQQDGAERNRAPDRPLSRLAGYERSEPAPARNSSARPDSAGEGKDRRSPRSCGDRLASMFQPAVLLNSTYSICALLYWTTTSSPISMGPSPRTGMIEWALTPSVMGVPASVRTSAAARRHAVDAAEPRLARQRGGLTVPLRKDFRGRLQDVSGSAPSSR